MLVAEGLAELGGGEGGEVVKGDVDSQEEAEAARGVECILRGAEGGPLDQRAGLAGWESGAKEYIAEDEGDELDEAYCAEGPCEADLREHVTGDEGEDDAPRGAAAGADSEGERALGGEVGREGGDGRTEDEAVGEAHADALGEEELGVGGREGGCEDAEELEEGARQEDEAEVAGVGEAAGEGADEEEEEDLGGTDPGDGGGREGEEIGVVGLEDAKRVDEAPGFAELTTTRLAGRFPHLEIIAPSPSCRDIDILLP